MPPHDNRIRLIIHFVPFSDHASHVVMSVVKLMSRIVAPSDLENRLDDSNTQQMAELHDHTYGITSDPLTQFACAFSGESITCCDHSILGEVL